MSEFFCTECGRKAPLKLGYLVTDPHYAIVHCRGKDQIGIPDQHAAELGVAQRASKKAADAALREERAKARDDEIARERKAAFGR
jgi:hypothetical protein